MAPAGIAAFEKRSIDKSAIYAYEQRRTPKFGAAAARAFRANDKAWAFSGRSRQDISASPPTGC